MIHIKKSFLNYITEIDRNSYVKNENKANFPDLVKDLSVMNVFAKFLSLL